MGAPRSKFVAGATGDNLVFYDEQSEASWIDAIGRDVRKWEFRYGADLTTAKEFTVTEIGAGGTEVQGIAAGVRALLTTGTTKWDSVELQLIGTPFQLETNKPLYFGASVALDSETLSDFIVGIGSTDTTLFTAGADTLDIAASFVGFNVLKSAVINAFNEIHASGTATTACDTALTTDSIVLEFFYDGAGTLTFYINRELQATHTTYVPTVVMTPSIGIKAASGAARACAINWMRCIQIV